MKSIILSLLLLFVVFIVSAQSERKTKLSFYRGLGLAHCLSIYREAYSFTKDADQKMAYLPKLSPV